MGTFEATVREIVRETADTVTLVLDADVPRDYLAGQFLNINPHELAATRALALKLEQRKGKKERPRAYSLGSAPHEPYFSITVKGESGGAFPPLLTPYLTTGLQVGDKFPCAGFAGLYTLPDDLPPDAHVVHLCAGSGIVPNFGMLKDALHRGLPQRHTLLYSNKTWDDVIYRESLTRLEAAHAPKLNILHALTRDSTGAPPGVLHGRLNEAHLRAHVPSLDNAWFFICGPSIATHVRLAAKARGETAPPQFLESMKALLLGLGIPKARINSEGW
jgi:ferredoxin-NADP reductase